MTIQVIVASTRPGRVGERVGRWVARAAAERDDFEVELVDLADYTLPYFDEPVSPRYNSDRRPNPVAQRWLKKLSEADGYVFVTPEYNHSIPGTLKNAIDYTDFQLAKKPAAIVSYGTVGGARAAEHLKMVLTESKMALVPEAVALMGAAGVLDENGNFLGDTSNTHGPVGALRHVLDELAWWTKTLKAGRKQLVLT